MDRIIFLRWRNKREAVRPRQIYYVEGYNRHLIIYTAKGNIEVVGKMNDICACLPESHFVRIHQGFTVNMNYVESVTEDGMLMKNGNVLPISVRKRKQALEKYYKYCENGGE